MPFIMRVTCTTHQTMQNAAATVQRLYAEPPGAQHQGLKHSKASLAQLLQVHVFPAVQLLLVHD